jgi:predicted transcriptional regulator of viral defense system
LKRRTPTAAGVARPARTGARVEASPWQALLELAASQDGLFSASQAKAARVSPQLLTKYAAGGRVDRIGRALYRVRYFPAGEHEDLVGVWLWSRREGVFSHETALFLHELSDALPVRAHITLPKRRRELALRASKGVAVHHADIAEDERGWVGPIPVTSVRRTLLDCFHGTVSSELVAQASAQAAERGLIAASEVITAPQVTFWRRPPA